MTSAGDYTVLKQIIGNYSFQGVQAWTTSQPIVTTNTTSSTGTGTGALVVSGGASIAGNLYAKGALVPIVQYSTIVFGSATTKTINLPVAYTNTLYAVTFGDTVGVGIYYTIASVNSFTITTNNAATVSVITCGV